MIGPAVVKEIQMFFSSRNLTPSVNTTHARLIPKNLDGKRVEDYSPIVLCVVFYKIISNMLTICLKLVLSFFISENQSAFVQRRAISYNVIITHEILQYLKTSQAQKNCSMAVKTNKSKAYDMYELDFKSKVLQKIGFHTT